MKIEPSIKKIFEYCKEFDEGNKSINLLFKKII